ncbi:hypothetical protein MRY87_02340 [bacterium]|nr:hypothetical protein [bacterium]
MKLAPFCAVVGILLLTFSTAAFAIERLEGWPQQLPSGTVIFSSPLAAELDGNETNGKEIVVANGGGSLYAFYADGSLYWSASTPNSDCPHAGPTNKILSSPAVGALYGDGVPYVVIGYGGIGVRSCGGGVSSFHGRTGERIATFDVRKDAPSENIYTVFSTPALYDTDNSGTLEIGFGSFSRKIYLLESNGKRLRSSLITGDTVWSSPAFARFGEEPFASLVIGTDISRNDAMRPPTPNGGYLYRLRTVFSSGSKEKVKKKKKCSRIKKKRRRKRCRRRQKRRQQQSARNSAPLKHGFRSDEAMHWYQEFDQTIFSAPVIADLLPNRVGREIAIGSGCFFPQSTANKRGKWLKILSSDGRVRKTLPAPGCNESAPTVADLDGDGDLELIATFNAGGESHSLGYVVAWDPESGEELWRSAPSFQGNDESGSFKMSAVAGDLNGNGAEEIVVLNGGAVHILDGTTGEPVPCESSACKRGLSLLKVGSSGRNTPALVDLDNNGDLELIVASGKKVHIFTDFADLSTSPGNLPPYSTTWPMWRGNPARTGEVQP